MPGSDRAAATRPAPLGYAAGQISSARRARTQPPPARLQHQQGGRVGTELLKVPQGRVLGVFQVGSLRCNMLMRPVPIVRMTSVRAPPMPSGSATCGTRPARPGRPPPIPARPPTPAPRLHQEADEADLAHLVANLLEGRQQVAGGNLLPAPPLWPTCRGCRRPRRARPPLAPRGRIEPGRTAVSTHAGSPDGASAMAG